MKTVSAIGGFASAAAVIAAVGWPGVTAVVALITLPLAGMLWVLNSIERSRHLVLVITAVRGCTRAAVTPLGLSLPSKTCVTETA